VKLEGGGTNANFKESRSKRADAERDRSIPKAGKKKHSERAAKPGQGANAPFQSAKKKTEKKKKPPGWSYLRQSPCGHRDKPLAVEREKELAQIKKPTN